MLDQLLESSPRTRRSGSQVAISVVAHTAVIGAALFATAHAHVRTVDEKPARIFWPRMYIPPARPDVKRAHPIAGRRLPSIWIEPQIVLPDPVIAGAATDASVDVSEFRHGPTLSGIGVGESDLPRTRDEPFRSDQVESPAALAPGNAPPVYPEQLRRNGVEGNVVATFIIDTTGKAEGASIRFAKDGNALFEESVRSALGRMQFIPARVGGSKVRQIVEMPFLFTINR